jgi:hypothetical protein
MDKRGGVVRVRTSVQVHRALDSKRCSRHPDLLVDGTFLWTFQALYKKIISTEPSEVLGPGTRRQPREDGSPLEY